MDDDSENEGGAQLQSQPQSQPQWRPEAAVEDDRPILYRLGTNQSSSSIFEDVEMAQDELYSGPMAESLPTSVAAFSHRRSRADSTTSFTYYNEEEDGDQARLARLASGEDGAGGTFDIEEIPFVFEEEDGLFEEEESSGAELENGNGDADYAMRRRSSTLSRSSVHARLLRSDSITTELSARVRTSFERGHKHGSGHGRVSQKLRMVNEDLTIVIAGFRTNRMRYILYLSLCVITLGLAYLLLRWLPRWLVRLIGEPSPLRESQWVVLEVGRLLIGFFPYSPFAILITDVSDYTLERMGGNGGIGRADSTVRSPAFHRFRGP